MGKVIVSLFLAGLLAACARAPAPAPAETAAETPPAEPVSASVADAPPATPAVAGEGCWMRQHDRGPQPQYLPDSPVGVMVRFYELHAPHASAGVPDADELETYRPLLTRGLIAALERARAERDAALAKAPGDKPPYVEGALFASLFEGYTQVQPQTVATEGWVARVPACFAYASASGRSEWIDTIVLRKEDGEWRVDDVVYGGQWDFANQGRLRDSLPAAE